MVAAGSHGREGALNVRAAFAAGNEIDVVSLEHNLGVGGEYRGETGLINAGIDPLGMTAGRVGYQLTARTIGGQFLAGAGRRRSQGVGRSAVAVVGRPGFYFRDI